MKILLIFAATMFMGQAFAQLNEYKKVFFNECMANRVVTRDNEKYQVAFCNDRANLEMQGLKDTAIEQFENAINLLKYSDRFLGISGRKFEEEGNDAPNTIRLYNKLNAFQNPFASSEYRKIIKEIYSKLKPLSIELIRIQKIEEAKLIGRDARCKLQEGTGRYTDECVIPNDFAWFHQNNTLTLTLTPPR